MKVLDLLAILSFILFLGLKLAGIIPWSWWWVTSPLWSYFSVTVALAFWAAKLERENKRKILEMVEESKKRQGKTKFESWVEGARAKQGELKNKK